MIVGVEVLGSLIEVIDERASTAAIRVEDAVCVVSETVLAVWFTWGGWTNDEI